MRSARSINKIDFIEIRSGFADSRSAFCAPRTARPTKRRPGQFAIARTGDLTKPLTVNYTVAGSAINGGDYQLISGAAKFAAGAAKALINIVPIRIPLQRPTKP
jgi:hypothetical protein